MHRAGTRRDPGAGMRPNRIGSIHGESGDFDQARREADPVHPPPDGQNVGAGGPGTVFSH